MIPSDPVQRLVLRVLGSACLLALPFAFIPDAWMDAIHQALGMGALPREPIVGYLARSLSLFYALLGGLYWVVSLDLPRYRPLLRYLGAAMILFAIAMFGIDWAESMPPFWRWWEGPIVALYGLTILWFSRRRPQAATPDRPSAPAP